MGLPPPKTPSERLVWSQRRRLATGDRRQKQILAPYSAHSNHNPNVRTLSFVAGPAAGVSVKPAVLAAGITCRWAVPHDTAQPKGAAKAAVEWT